jgi:hypothetical protein
MIGALIGAMAGYKLGDKYLSGTRETPVWTGHLGGDLSMPAMTIMQVRYRGKISYRLYVITNGNAVLVAVAQHYPEIVAAVQTWDRYLDEGGTVEGWLVHNQHRVREMDRLEASWQA